MNYTEDEIERSLPFQPLKEVIESRRLNGYTLFMAHYYHHRQKEIDDENSFDIDIEDSMISGNDFISEIFTRQGIQSWHGFSINLKNSSKKSVKALNERPMKGEFDQLPRELGRTASELKETLRVEIKRE